MPGFVVGGFGGKIGSGVGISTKREYYYNYFWEVNNLFGTNFGSDPALVGLKEAGTPTFTVNKESYIGASLEYKFAKNITWEDVKVTWYDSVDLISHIKKWRETVWTPETGIRPANAYKQESNLQYFLPTGKRTNVWYLKNSWPSQVRSGDLTYTSSDVKIVEVTITYDWAEEIPG